MMGVQLTAAALATWAPHVSDRAFRVLIRMSATALDKPSNGQPAGQYFGGMDLLAMTLRPERGGTKESAHRTVRRALTELVKVGAIESVERGRRGARAVYKLTLDNDPPGLQSPPIWTPESSNDADSGLQSPNGGHLVSSLGTTGTTKDDERQEDEVVASPAVVQTERDESAANDELPVEDGCCPDCGTYLDPDGTCFNRHCPLTVVA